jgi:ABC-type transport system substrate-binding protein
LLLNDYPWDLDKAKALLKEAGYPQGFEMNIAVQGPGCKSDPLRPEDQEASTASVRLANFSAAGANAALLQTPLIRGISIKRKRY